MIPKDFIHKCMFVFLYDFTNRFKSLFFILILYIFLLFYFSINDGYVIISFVLTYAILIIKPFDINKTLNKVSSEYPHTTLIDWYKASYGHDSFFSPDAVHLEPSGAKYFASLIAKTIEKISTIFPLMQKRCGYTKR